MKITRRALIVNGIRAAVAGTLGTGFFRRDSIEVVRNDVPIQGLPRPFVGFRIAQISDIHSSFWVSEPYIRRCVEVINGLNGHMVALTGDFITGGTLFLNGKMGRFNPEYLDRCIRALRHLRSPLLLAVLGNHDMWSGKKEALRIAQALENIGILVLRNQGITIRREGAEIRVIGVDDYWSQSFNLQKALRDLPMDETRILLCHNPDVNDEWSGATDRGVDLILSGHTHGGQINIPWIGAPFLPSRFGQKYRAGAVRDGKRWTYVNRGAGTLIFPFRLNCPPEITLHVLRRA